jgi:hypothetical protein
MRFSRHSQTAAFVALATALTAASGGATTAALGDTLPAQATLMAGTKQVDSLAPTSDKDADGGRPKAKTPDKGAKGTPPSGKGKGGKPPSGAKPPAGKGGSRKQPSGRPPSGAPGNGGAPGKGGAPGNGAPGAGPGGSGGSAVTGSGALTIGDHSADRAAAVISATKNDESGVLVKEGGKLVLSRPTVRTDGASSSSDDSSFYGLDAGILADGSYIKVDGGSVTTTGEGANGLFAFGPDADIEASAVRVAATGRYAHGVMVSGGASLTASDLDVTTTGANSAAVATDRGGGTIAVTGGTFHTTGANSPGIYSTGAVSATDATFVATGAEAVVVEGSNSVELVKSTLSAGKDRGVMIYQSLSGDAQGQAGTFKMTGGSLRATSGPLFFVTNTSALIELSGAKLAEPSGVLLDVAASRWGPTAANGGSVVLDAVRQSLSGSVEADRLSSVTLDLKTSSSLTGAVNTANTAKSVTVVLDKSSTWTVTAGSHLTALEDAGAISHGEVTNIIGNGHTVYYDPAANPDLDGRTYKLVDGGTLRPS